MMDDRVEEILEELETRPNGRIRNRIECESCGSKDHVKLVKEIKQEKGNKIYSESYKCAYCRKFGGKFRKKGNKRS
jgi:hypothetical protein